MHTPILQRPTSHWFQTRRPNIRDIDWPVEPPRALPGFDARSSIAQAMTSRTSGEYPRIHTSLYGRKSDRLASGVSSAGGADVARNRNVLHECFRSLRRDDSD